MRKHAKVANPHTCVWRATRMLLAFPPATCEHTSMRSSSPLALALTLALCGAVACGAIAPSEPFQEAPVPAPEAGEGTCFMQCLSQVDVKGLLSFSESDAPSLLVTGCVDGLCEGRRLPPVLGARGDCERGASTVAFACGYSVSGGRVTLSLGFGGVLGPSSVMSVRVARTDDGRVLAEAEPTRPATTKVEACKQTCWTGSLVLAAPLADAAAD